MSRGVVEVSAGAGEVDSVVVSSGGVVSLEGASGRRAGLGVAWLLLVGGVIGLWASFQLTLEKIRMLSEKDYIPSCDLNPVLSCGSVITTPQASVFGFPNPVFGLTGFTVVITLGVLLVCGVVLPRWVWLGLNVGALLAFAGVQWLVWQSLYVIGALCPWCMVVWSVTVPIFVWVTVENLRSGRLPVPGSWGSVVEVVSGLRGALVAAWFVAVAGLIFVRWQSFWLGSL